MAFFSEQLRNSRFGKNMASWGWRGASASFLTGAGQAFGMQRTLVGAELGVARQTWKFAGFRNIGRSAMGIGAGYLAYKMTGNPVVGLGVGAAGLALSRGSLGNALGPVATLFGMYQGFREGGLGGAVRGAAESALSWGAFELGKDILSVGFKGTTIGNMATGLGRLVLNPFVMIPAAIAYGTYRAVKGLAKMGRKSQLTEFVGNMQAFRTEAAYTMRQRSLQEINRSHTNARTILGQEASYMHL